MPPRAIKMLLEARGLHKAEKKEIKSQQWVAFLRIHTILTYGCMQ